VCVCVCVCRKLRLCADLSRLKILSHHNIVDFFLPFVSHKLYQISQIKKSKKLRIIIPRHGRGGPFAVGGVKKNINILEYANPPRLADAIHPAPGGECILWNFIHIKNDYSFYTNKSLTNCACSVMNLNLNSGFLPIKS